jgi:hypothetical protein
MSEHIWGMPGGAMDGIWGVPGWVWLLVWLLFWGGLLALVIWTIARVTSAARRGYRRRRLR